MLHFILMDLTRKESQGVMIQETAIYWMDFASMETCCWQKEAKTFDGRNLWILLGWSIMDDGRWWSLKTKKKTKTNEQKTKIKEDRHQGDEEQRSIRESVHQPKKSDSWVINDKIPAFFWRNKITQKSENLLFPLPQLLLKSPGKNSLKPSTCILLRCLDESMGTQKEHRETELPKIGPTKISLKQNSRDEKNWISSLNFFCEAPWFLASHVFRESKIIGAFWSPCWFCRGYFQIPPLFFVGDVEGRHLLCM